MTPEAKSLAASDPKRHDARVVDDAPCVSLDWSQSADYAEPAG